MAAAAARAPRQRGGTWRRRRLQATWGVPCPPPCRFGICGAAQALLAAAGASQCVMHRCSQRAAGVGAAWQGPPNGQGASSKAARHPQRSRHSMRTGRHSGQPACGQQEAHGLPSKGITDAGGQGRTCDQGICLIQVLPLPCLTGQCDVVAHPKCICPQVPARRSSHDVPSCSQLGRCPWLAALVRISSTGRMG